MQGLGTSLGRREGPQMRRCLLTQTTAEARLDTVRRSDTTTFTYTAESLWNRAQP